LGGSLVRQIVRNQCERPVVPHSSTPAGFLECGVYRVEWFGERTHRDAKHNGYAASKAALISLTRTISGEFIGRDIRVNAISPGPITTPLYGKLGLGEADLTNVAGSVQGQVPAGRFGSASEIAHAALFFASDESALTVGSELLIDGGMSNI
jgi:NAD(P)-dependent dehydrogenase (short-subunit alcohol dehydrogenase family)